MSLSGGGIGGSRIIMADLITGRLDFSLATFNSARSNMDASGVDFWPHVFDGKK
jgi:hypothetical protein